MVQSFSQEDDKNTAIYAGVMVSVFTFGEFLMAPQWAKISDRIGRKPTLLIGSMGAIFSALIFGFSSSLPMAIGARVCAGILNPNLGVLQTFVGELVPKEHQGMRTTYPTLHLLMHLYSQRLFSGSIPSRIWVRISSPLNIANRKC